MAITAPPQPPLPTDDEITFNTKAGPWLDWQYNSAAEFNALEANVEAKETLATDAATTATTKAGEASVSAALAEDWAIKPSAVGGAEHSAKSHAVGAAPTGSAKDWATKLADEVVAGQGYSARQYALNAGGSASAASDSASSANASKIAAGESATAAWASKLAAGESAAAAFASEQKAEAWAEGVGEVEPGQYSAKHWAQQAADVVTDGVIDDSTTSAVKTWSSQKIAAELDNVQTVHLNGDPTPYVTQTKPYTITNYNAFSDYIVQVSAGSVSIAGDTITFTAPATAGAVTLTVTMDGVPQAFAIDVQAATVLAPTITSPANGATGVIETPTFSTAAFQTVGLADTHLDTDWELWTGPNRTGTLIWSALASTTNKTDITLPAGVVSVSTTYHLDVLHRGTTLGASAWTEHSFTTAATFNSYIATPSPTPANFGDAFEGGFYAGMYWGQIAQSSSSKTLATGEQSFTVPDMTAAPIVYGGQTLEVRSRANPANKFIGTVTGAVGTTLTLNVTSIGGSGTFSDWSVMSRFRSIEAPKSSGEHAGIALKNANTAFPTACQTLTEGWAATLAMVAAGDATTYPAAHWARSLTIGGYNDWHIPARDVRELAWRNLKPVTDSNYVTANRATGQSFDYKRDGAYGDTANTHGTNNNSSPTGPAYTASVPDQTAATAFRTGGAEAFEFGASYYWSSTEYSASFAWCQSWDSSFPGRQDSRGKANAYRVRAVRRSII